MRISKILTYIGIIALIFVPSVRNAVASFTQSLVIKSGLANVSDDADKTESFNYNLRIADLTGATIDFNQYKGKVIFLNLWATWCGPCRSEMPIIQNLYNEVDHDKISFVMLSIDDVRLRSRVKAFIQAQGFTFPTYMAEELTEQLNVPTIPTTFIIDKQGMIVKKEVGMKNYDTSKFKKFLKQLADK